MNAKKKRMHIVIDEHQAKRLKEVARKRGTSVSFLLREAVAVAVKMSERMLKVRDRFLREGNGNAK